ncbi:MAG: 5-methylcytosine-specific restriction endonuclease McrA [Loktanella salsilacus]|jgi:5-methylcytosine-specific restriction endonuclease McrA
MSRPPHLCQCGRIVPHGVSCACQIASQRARNKRHDANRLSASARGYNAAWRKARLEWLTMFPACAHPGCNAQATTVDHIIPHRGDQGKFWDKTNWQSLCTHHHNAHKQRTERANQ